MNAGSEMPTIVLVGRPNVGKSTLFNRLLGARKALVHATPGLTRDRRIEEVNYDGFRFRIVDTGGMAFDPDGQFSAEIEAQIAAGVEQADCIWLVTDGAEGLFSPFPAPFQG